MRCVPHPVDLIEVMGDAPPGSERLDNRVLESRNI